MKFKKRKKRTVGTKFKNMFLSFGVMAVTAVLLMFLTVMHLGGNLTSISNNKPVSWLQATRQTKPTNHEATFVFYRSNCPHCQKKIPYVYVMNKLMGKKVQYRDLNQTVNNRLSNQLHNRKIPTADHVIMQNRAVKTQEIPLYQGSFTQRVARVLFIFGAMLVLAFAVSFLLF